MDIFPLQDILNNCGVSYEEWMEMQRNPRFIAYLEANVTEWTGSKNTADRVKLKSAVLLEEWLPKLHEEMHGTAASLNAKVEAAKLLAKIAGVDQHEGEAGGGNGFHVTINIGGQSKTITLPSNSYSNVVNELE